MKPIRPEHVITEKKKTLPHEVIECFNNLIAERWNGYSAKFKQKEVVASILEKMNYGKVTQKKIEENELYKKHWLDVEDIYREAGWKVSFDKPAYNEDYDASFEFRKPSGRDTPTPGGYI